MREHVRRAAPSAWSACASGVPSLNSIGSCFAGAARRRAAHIGELADRRAGGNLLEAALAQDRGFERELRRQSGAHLLLGRRRAGLVVEDGVAAVASAARCGRRAPSAELAARRTGCRMLAADLGMQRRDSLARRAASQPASHAAMRRKRGHQNARASGNPPAAAKCRSPMRGQRRHRIVRQLVRRTSWRSRRSRRGSRCRGRRAPGGVSTASSGASFRTCLA